MGRVIVKMFGFNSREAPQYFLHPTFFLRGFKKNEEVFVPCNCLIYLLKLSERGPSVFSLENPLFPYWIFFLRKTKR
jgi:hypothetical protein